MFCISIYQITKKNLNDFIKLALNLEEEEKNREDFSFKVTTNKSRY